MPRSVSVPLARASSGSPDPVSSPSRRLRTPARDSRHAAGVALRQRQPAGRGLTAVRARQAGARLSHPAEEKHDEESCPVSMNQVCAICLEFMESKAFQFPCGHRHCFHHECAMELVGSVVLQPREPLEMNRVAHRLFEAGADVLRRIRCPLCRAKWPNDAFQIRAAVESLRAGFEDMKIRGAEKLGRVLCSLHEKAENPDLVASTRAAFRRMLRTSIRPSVRILGRWVGHTAVGNFLGALRASDIMRFRATSLSCDVMCRAGEKVRLPHVRVRKVNAAVKSGWGSGVVTLDVDCAARGWQVVGGLSHKDIRALDEWLQGNVVLQSCFLPSCSLANADEGGWKMASLLRGKPQLRHVDLANNSLTDDALTRVAAALAPVAHSTLESFVLDLNCVTQAGLKAVLKYCGAGSIRLWGLRHNALGDEGCHVLAETAWPTKARSLQECQDVSLDLRRNNVTASGAKVLAPLMCKAWGSVRLGCNLLGDSGCASLFSSCCGHRFGFRASLGDRLTSLELGMTKFGDQAASALSFALRDADALQELHLPHNVIGPDGAQELAVGIQYPRRLKFVDLAANPVRSSGVVHLADQIRQWPQERLDIRLLSVECGDGAARAIVTALHEVAKIRGRGRVTINLTNNSQISFGTHKALRDLSA